MCADYFSTTRVNIDFLCVTTEAMATWKVLYKPTVYSYFTHRYTHHRHKWTRKAETHGELFDAQDNRRTASMVRGGKEA